MPAEVNSSALTLLNRALGISGQLSAQTELDDGVVVQIVDVGDVARRSISPGGGLFWGLIRTIHGIGATDRGALVDPYNPQLAAGGSVSERPYPVLVSSAFDCYILGAQVSLSTQANFVDCHLQLNVPQTNMGWGILDNAGTESAANTNAVVFLADWPTPDGSTQGSFAKTGTGQVWVPMRHRIRRGSTLEFLSQASNAIQYSCHMLLALQPVCLGQDVAV